MYLKMFVKCCGRNRSDAVLGIPHIDICLNARNRDFRCFVNIKNSVVGVLENFEDFLVDSEAVGSVVPGIQRNLRFNCHLFEGITSFLGWRNQI